MSLIPELQVQRHKPGFLCKLQNAQKDTNICLLNFWKKHKDTKEFFSVTAWSCLIAEQEKAVPSVR